MLIDITVLASQAEYQENGKSDEVWNNIDALGMLQQLGVIPAPGQAE
jgi:hypothetical protein